MTDSKRKDDALGRPRKRWPKSGLYSWVDSKRMPTTRGFKAIRQDLGRLREGLIEQHGGEGGIAPDARVLVDQIVEAVGVQKILGAYIRKFGLVDGAAAAEGRLEVCPAVGRNWISFSNTARQAILALRELERGRRELPQHEIAEAILTSYSREEPPVETEGALDKGEGQVEAEDTPGCALEDEDGHG